MFKLHKVCNVFIAAFLLTIAFYQSAFAMIPVIDALNAKLNLVTSLKTATMVIQQIQQIQNQLQAIKYQATNLKTLSGQNWDNARQSLSQLGNAMQQGKSLAYSASNVDQQFKQRFPGYTGSQGSTSDYSGEYKKWVQTNQDTMNGVMDQINASYEQQSQEEALDQLLAQKAKTPQGRMQALQVGNEIAAEQIAQMQKLKATMMAQANAQAEYYAYQAQKDAAKQQSVDAVVKTSGAAYPQYQGKSQFGLIPQFGSGG